MRSEKPTFLELGQCSLKVVKAVLWRFPSASKLSPTGSELLPVEGGDNPRRPLPMLIKKESIVQETEYCWQILEFIMRAFQRNKFGRCRAVVGAECTLTKCLLEQRSTAVEYELNKAHAKFYHPPISAYLVSILFLVLKSSVKIQSLSYARSPRQSFPGLQCLYIWSDKKK